MPWKIHFRIVVVAIVVIVVAFIAAQHVTAQFLPPPWASSAALGDVAVSSDSAVDIRGNENPFVVSETLTGGLTGTNGGLIYDDSLNLVVANTAGDQLVKFAPVGTVSGRPFVTIPTQDAPRSLAIAKDGTIYVASAGKPRATVRRIAPGATCAQNAPCPQFTVPTDSATDLCIGIDLDDQNTLYFVSGGRTVKSVANVNTLADEAEPSANVFANLDGSGTACGLRLLAPLDARTIPAPTTPTPLGVVVADKNNVRLVRGSSQTTFDTGSGSKNWVDVAVDSKLDIFAVNAGNTPSLARFRIGGTDVAITLTSTPRGVAINGEQRYAQTIRGVVLTANQYGEAKFLQGTPYQHAWNGQLSVAALFAVQAIEVRPEPKPDEVPNNNSVCPASLYIDCRLSPFNPFRLANPPVQSATPKTYSRERSVFYREIVRAPLPLPPATFTTRIKVIFPADINETDELAGEICVVGGKPRKASAMARDAWVHNVFDFDPSAVFYGGDDGVTTRTISKTNDTIIVERDAQYFMRIIKPTADSIDPEGRPVATVNLGRSLPIAVEVRRPLDCSFVDNLELRLVLSVVDITQGADTIIGDSIGANGTFLGSSGGIFAKTASQYRTNLLVKNPPYQSGHTYRVCVTAGAAEAVENPLGPVEPLAAEACRDVLVN